MNTLDQYKIDLVTLRNEEYSYQFTIHDDFFQAMETDMLEKASLTAQVTLRKSELMLLLDFHIEGILGLLCDRSLEPFDYPIAIDERLILQFGDKDEVIDDEMEIISRNAQSVSLAQYLYEYVAMAIPFKKLHPKFADEMEDDEEIKLIYSSSTSQDGDTTEEYIDPRWENLKKLNKN